MTSPSAPAPETPQAAVNGSQQASCGASAPCKCGCGAGVRQEHGRAYVDGKHRLRAWAQRQASLDFTGPSGWTPAQRELSANLDKRESRKARMLARLQQGEATTWELMQIGGSGWRSRLHELKLDGHPYTCENRLDYAVYRLEANS